MAKYVQNGEYIDYPNTTGAAIKFESVIAFPTFIAVAVADIPDGETGAIALDGAFAFPTAAEVIALGARVFWDAANQVVTTASEGNTPAGIAITANPTAAAGTVVVKIG